MAVFYWNNGKQRHVPKRTGSKRYKTCFVYVFSAFYERQVKVAVENENEQRNKTFGIYTAIIN